MKMTIYDIKYNVQDKTHYFDRGTLKFFGQTLKDFHVRTSPTGRIFIYAPSRWNGKLMGYSFAEYLPAGTLETPRTEEGGAAEHYTIEQVISYINTH